MSKPYVRLDKEQAAVLLVDHQAGLLSIPAPANKGGQPNASWCPQHGYWKINDGKGGKTRYGPDGGFLTPEQLMA